MTTLRLAAAAACAAAAALVPATGALASPGGDPDVSTPATPAHACAAIPATLAQFGVSVPFSFSSCVRTLAARVPDVPGFGSPYAQCAALEAGIETPDGVLKISYPFTFHDAPGDPFPNLVANDRTQCARALWTFHTIESQLPAGPE